MVDLGEYYIDFDKDIKVQDVLDELNAEDGVELAHGNLPVRPNQVTYSVFNPGDCKRPPNYNDGYEAFKNEDPLLRKQWHYKTIAKNHMASKKILTSTSSMLGM